MKEIIELSKNEYYKFIEENEMLLVDIREKEEFADFNIGGINVPAHLLSDFNTLLNNQEKIIVVCSNGMRSSIISRVLNSKLKNTTIYHLTEGVF